MAFDLWRGPGGTAGAPTSGDFMTATNWLLGLVPFKDLNVALGAGDYAVTLSNASAAAKSLSIGTGATLALVDTTAPAILTLYGDSVKGGTVALSGSAPQLEAGVQFANFGAMTFVNAGGYVGQFGGGGTLLNEASIGLAAGGGYGLILSTLVNDAAGIVSASGGGLFLAGTTTNRGRIEATNGGVVTTSGGAVGLGDGTVTNLSGSTLSAGTWAVGANSTLQLAGTTISTLGAGTVVTLDGVNSQFRLDDGSGAALYLEGTLDRIDAGATLEVLGGRDWGASENLSVGGTLHLGGGIFAPGDLRTDAGSLLTGHGSIASQAIVNGRMAVDGGETLQFVNNADFNGRIGGAGTLELSGGGDTFTTGRVSVRHLLLDGADIQFDRSLKYAGELTATAGTIELKDSTLTLAGKATLLGDDVRIQGGPDGKLSVTGDLHASDGEVELDVRTLRVDGEVRVDHGALLVNAAVLGSGGFTVGVQGELEFEAASRLGAAGPLVTLAGAGATLTFDSLGNNGARVAGFDGHDRIDFAALDPQGARLNWNADADGAGGTLKVTNGTQTAFVHLKENHARVDFKLVDDGAGGTAVTLGRNAAATGFDAIRPAAFGADAHGAAHSFAPMHEVCGLLALV